jgi:hypothetical protein
MPLCVRAIMAAGTIGERDKVRTCTQKKPHSDAADAPVPVSTRECTKGPKACSTNNTTAPSRRRSSAAAATRHHRRQPTRSASSRRRCVPVRLRASRSAHAAVSMTRSRGRPPQRIRSTRGRHRARRRCRARCRGASRLMPNVICGQGAGACVLFGRWGRVGGCERVCPQGWCAIQWLLPRSPWWIYRFLTCSQLPVKGPPSSAWWHSSPHHLFTSSPHHLFNSSPHHRITASPHHLREVVCAEREELGDGREAAGLQRAARHLDRTGSSCP